MLFVVVAVVGIGFFIAFFNIFVHFARMGKIKAFDVTKTVANANIDIVIGIK